MSPLVANVWVLNPLPKIRWSELVTVVPSASAFDTFVTVLDDLLATHPPVPDEKSSLKITAACVEAARANALSVVAKSSTFS